MNKEDLILVAGAGGFIGGHLVASLIRDGYENIRAIDIKPLEEWHQTFEEVENQQGDLRLLDVARKATRGVSYVYNLAADMGGMGFIETNKAACMLSVLVNTHLLMAAREFHVKRFFFSSTACVYAAGKQMAPRLPALKEEDAYPAMPEDGYGWEKLFSERLCRHFREDFGVITRIARYHNVYGPNGAFEGGREKAPAALCRKIAQAQLSGNHSIDIWGDGEQTRSFMYIDDCVFGTKAIMMSAVAEPLNLGSSELVTINQLVDLIEEIAGIKVQRKYQLNAPQGVRGRNSDNTRIREALGWEPSIPLRAGLEQTYQWIYDQLVSRVPELAGRNEHR
ncbi:MAG: NAD-dependent epimerase/dehydratase family protein [Verrucomicrobia bacterium]|nr:NAD-dependent epimerase/dehydratase family protein [Verrucomicrobiota bacterium]MBU6446591.1 NAD-dependent epimerase/dehydratase family protein [Verrucomicrobiota bacterium]MDE3047633.1 NAD-dependent epimerase/dehydratase family protein [Verrucomicrobiota bacterium]